MRRDAAKRYANLSVQIFVLPGAISPALPGFRSIRMSDLVAYVGCTKNRIGFPWNAPECGHFSSGRGAITCYSGSNLIRSSFLGIFGCTFLPFQLTDLAESVAGDFIYGYSSARKGCGCGYFQHRANTAGIWFIY
jgi:hypothetical protein